MTAPTLANRERALTATLNAYDEAKRLAPKLKELANELVHQGGIAISPTTCELRLLEAEWATRAAELLRILAQEQWRQREAAKIFLHGRMSRSELRAITESWNGDPPK